MIEKPGKAVRIGISVKEYFSTKWGLGRPCASLTEECKTHKTGILVEYNIGRICGCEYGSFLSRLPCQHDYGRV